MGITKKINWESVFIFLFLIIFPLGQIIRLNFNFAGLNIPLLPIDIVAGLGAIYTILFQKKTPKFFKYIAFFLAVTAFSFIFSITIFHKSVLYGAFYLFRIFAYAYFFVYVWNFAKKGGVNKRLLVNSLISVSIFSAIFGWIQFVSVPDLKPLYYIGWDMHLYRLAGSFLDPTFLGLIIVFGLSISINEFLDSGKKWHIPIIVFFLISLAFTYARAAYLAFFMAVIVIGIAKKKLRKTLYLAIALGIIALILPTAKNHSIVLTRTFSIDARFANYREALEVFRHSPIFGVGYNNMCIARNVYIGEEPFTSHACSGSDSSILLILATTGIIGLMVFLGNIFKLLKSLKGLYVIPVLAGFAALLVHSVFSNSLFFPWVMGYMGILLSVAIKE